MKKNKVMFVGWLIMTVLVIGSIFGMMYGKEIGYYIGGDSRNEYIVPGGTYGVMDLLPAPLGLSLVLFAFMFQDSIEDIVFKRRKRV